MESKLKWILVIVFSWLLGWYSHQAWQPLKTWLLFTKATLTQTTKSNAAPEKNQTAKTKQITKISSPQLTFRTWLNQEQFQKAINQYIKIKQQGDEQNINIYRQLILTEIKQRQQNKKNSTAKTLLSLYLDIDYNNTEAMLALAENHALQQQYTLAIDLLYQVKDSVTEVKLRAQIEERIAQAVLEQAAVLLQGQNPYAVINFYQTMSQYDPNNGRWTLALAKAQMDRDILPEAMQTLSLLSYEPLWHHAAEKLRNEIQALMRGEGEPLATETIVPLAKSGEHYIVTAQINDFGSVHLLLDTGASLSIVKPSILDHLGISYQSQGELRLINTAGGYVYAPIFPVYSMSVAGQRLEQINIAAIELTDMAHIDGLLGMNFLKHFRFFIDQNQSTLHLTLNIDNNNSEVKSKSLQN